MGASWNWLLYFLGNKSIFSIVQARFLNMTLLEIRNGCYSLQFAKKNASKVYFQLKFKRIHVVGKGSRKKTEIGKFDIRKFPFKLESTNRRWRVLNAVLSYQKFSNFPTSFFTISFSTVQLPVFSNCTYSEKCLAYNYPTENFPITRYFQLNFPTSNL